MMVPSNNLEQYIPQRPQDTTPLAGTFTVGKDGIVVGLGKVLTQQDVLAQPDVWPSYTKVLQREFHTVEGVGVVF